MGFQYTGSYIATPATIGCACMTDPSLALALALPPSLTFQSQYVQCTHILTPLTVPHVHLTMLSTPLVVVQCQTFIAQSSLAGLG